MKWKRQDIKLEVSDPKGVVYLLFGCKGLPSTGHHKLGSRWATNISMVITGEGTMNVWSQLSCLNYVPSMRRAETAPACGDGLGHICQETSDQIICQDNSLLVDFDQLI